ncbi:uncharacterized protein LOC126834414 [Adelges cooleyi]|uniref:uncharacterized protein LOC126834414 n=1 Tax=Adelges cooleyi TaxID=133065 RepID=UPI00217F758F|nr:uncharacterized protein LOC126834414 [Adelges cooleyi]
MHSVLLLRKCKKMLKCGKPFAVDTVRFFGNNTFRVSTAEHQFCQNTTNNRLTSSSLVPSNRLYCKDYRPFPQVPEFPPIIWPSLFKTVGSWLYSYLVVRSQYDNTFNLVDFSNNSKKAVAVVSHSIAQRDFDSLEGLVTKDVLEQVKSIVSNLNDDEIKDMAFDAQDMYFYFPYQVEVVNDKNIKNRRFIEVTMCYHAIHNLEEVKKRVEDVENIQKELRSSIYVLNYRFIREYTEGVKDAWTVNAINHLKAEEHDKSII